MKLIILGSGTCVPSLKRGAPANFIKIGEAQILVDCGPGTLKQLEKANLSYKNIDMVFFTHFHVDHISDIGPLIQALNWTPGFERKKNLLLIGPEGFQAFYERYIKPVCGTPRPGTYKITIKEIKDNLEFDGFKVQCLKTVHSPESIAYKLIEKDKSLVISGDCDFDEPLSEFSKQADVLLLECSFANGKKMKGHLVSHECGRIAQEAGIKRLILTHLYPPLPGVKRLKEVKEIFPAATLAEDLMEVELR
ncbi:MAG: MBL fold metallo-hydrolase [Candidatus Aminicenantes bacterium]|nr:MBL fold metallo-hydrolase [Candidatus Aminicenantes bacterium]